MWPLSGWPHCLTGISSSYICSLLKPKFVFFPVKNFSKMEACYNKLCSCPICKSYWYVSYSTLLFVQWVPLNRHLPYADAWSKLPLDLLFCTHRNHDFSRVFRPSGPLVHPALQISCYEVTECFYTSLDEMLLRRRVPTPSQTIYTIHTIYTNIQTIYTPGWRETVRVKLKSCVRA